MAGAVVRRPLVPIALVAVLALAGAVLALRLEPVAGTDTLVSSSSDTAKANDAFAKQFGDDAVVVLVKGNLQRTMLTADNRKLIRLEACLSGDSPREVLGSPLPAVCDELRELRPAKVVFGPGTFLNTSVEQINEQLGGRLRANEVQKEQAAREASAASKRRGDPPAQQRRLGQLASEAVQSRFQQSLLQLALQYEITALPSIDKPEFVDKLVFQSGGQVGVPKARFAYLFPSSTAALITMRLRADLSEAERSRTIALVERVTSDPTFTPDQGARYVVSGVPVVVEALANEVQSGIFYLLGAALLVMAATLALVFRTRLQLRLLPLALALAAAAMTFGVLSLTGGGLTMATIAVLPVLIGLAVDYAIQSHARFDEESARKGADPQNAARAAAAAGGPTIAAAGVATAVGFLVLVLSPVPMVRDFGWLVVAGIAIALVCAFTAGLAALTRLNRGRSEPADLPPAFPRLRGRVADLAVDFGDSGPGRRAARTWRSARLGTLERSERALAMAVAQPRRVLAVALAIAVVGWAVDTQTEVVSDVRELVPSDLKALKDVQTLEEETGVAGEIDVTVRADDITRPEVVQWMSSYQEKTLEEAGYAEGDRCQQSDDPPDLCPAFSLPTILSQVDTSDQEAVRNLLDAVPAYFAQGVVTEDRTTANLAFGIRLQPLDDQQQVIERMKDGLDPPEGVRASVVGLPVLAAEANDALASPLRRAATLVAALVAVFLVLLLLGRFSGRRGRAGAREAAIPLIPIALATGWSAGILFLLGLLPEPLEVDLNPMSVTLGALVIAISTEFSVLLSARYRQEREAGAAPARAMELTYASTGAAVIASGTTAIAGFAALIFSDIQMLRDFGILTVVDLTVSLLGVMLVLPAALIWAEQRQAEKASAEPATNRPYAPTPA
ncbi:MAG: MMPL family transporter [Thermoleophilaceae bacterium]|nr:MMPL family transporter [Thermoleophilaceae bacterium]